MTVTVYLPLLIAPLFVLAATGAIRRLPPLPALWLVSIGSVALAAATLASLVLVASPLVAQCPGLSRVGGWSDAVLVAHDPVSTPMATVALILLVLCGGAAARVVAAQVRSLRSAYRLCARLGSSTELVVVPDARGEAYALPGRPGRIVVSAATLGALNGPERRALLAHERAHLAHRHHLHLVVVRCAAAVNPLLRPLLPAARLSCERAADERAAAVSGRGAVAAALLRTRALTAGVPPAPALAAAVSDMDLRIRALAAPAPRLIAWRLIVPLLLVAACVLSLGNAAAEIHSLFELAQTR